MGRRGGGRKGGGRRGGGRRGGGKKGGGGHRGGGHRGGGHGVRRGGAKRRGVHVHVGHGQHHHRRVHHHHQHHNHHRRRRFGHRAHVHYGYHRYYYGGSYYYYRHDNVQGGPRVLPMPDDMNVHDTFINQNIVGAECAGVGYPEWMADAQITQELANRGLTQEKFQQEIANINNAAYWGGYQCERYINHLPTILIVIGVIMLIVSVAGTFSAGVLVVAILLLIGGCCSYWAVERYSVNSYYDRIYDVEQHLNTLNSTYNSQRIRWEIAKGDGGRQLSIHGILVRPLDNNGQLLAGTLVNTLMKEPPADTDWNATQQIQPQFQVVVQQAGAPVQQVMVPVQGQQVVLQNVQGQLVQPAQGQQVIYVTQPQQQVVMAQPQQVIVQQPAQTQPAQQAPQYQSIQQQAQQIGN